MPKRVQMTRHKPWRHLHPEAVMVARPSRFGNPFTINAALEAGYTNAAEVAVATFARWLAGQSTDSAFDFHEEQRKALLAALPELRGKDLACWCAPGAPCHADVLLRLANEGHENED